MRVVQYFNHVSGLDLTEEIIGADDLKESQGITKHGEIVDPGKAPINSALDESTLPLRNSDAGELSLLGKLAEASPRSRKWGLSLCSCQSKDGLLELSKEYFPALPI